MLECCACLKPFDDERQKPMVGACGHSICQQCHGVRQKGGYGITKCPLCSRERAFKKAPVNYQMIDLSTKYAALLSEKEKEVDILKNLQKCSSCESRVEAKSLRICLDCCSKKDAICVDDEMEIVVKDSNEVEKSLLCGSCCLDGSHGCHKTVLYAPVELRSSVSKRFDEVRKNFREKYRSSLADSVFELTNTIFKLDEPLKKFQEATRKLKVNDVEVNLASLKSDERYFNSIMVTCIAEIKNKTQEIQAISSNMTRKASYWSAIISGEEQEVPKDSKKNSRSCEWEMEESLRSGVREKAGEKGEIYQFFLEEMRRGAYHLIRGDNTQCAIHLANSVLLADEGDVLLQFYRERLPVHVFALVLWALKEADGRLETVLGYSIREHMADPVLNLPKDEAFQYLGAHSADDLD